MKKYISVLLMLALSLTLMASCGRNEEEPTADEGNPAEDTQQTTENEEPQEPDEPQQPESEPLTLDGTFEHDREYTADDGTVVFDTILGFPKFSGGERAEKINSYMKELLDNAVADGENNIYPDALTAYEEGWPNSRYGLSSGWDIIVNTEKLLSVEMHLSSYTGGAHGNNGFIPVNFDSNGERITHEDLYIISDPAKAVAEIITDKLKKGETDLAGLGAEMFYSTELQDFAEYLDPDDFILTGEGVKIIYQPYAIAPFAAGAPTFLLTWEELDGIANNEWK